MDYFSDINFEKYKRYIDTGLGVIILYGVLFNYVHLITAVTNTYLPVWSDEFFYFVNTISFFENNVLDAALTYNGEGSHLLGVDAHGPGYPLLHGSIAEVFGWSNLNFIYFNFISLFLALVVIWFMKSITIAQKIWIANIALMFPFFMLYGFTFMQESVHVFTGLIISVLVYYIYKKDAKRIYISLFLITVFIAGIFRALWFFWLIGLIPLAITNKQLIQYICLFLLGIVVSFITVKFFTEPVPNYFSSVITLFKNDRLGEGVSSLFNHFYENLYSYFIGEKNNLLYRSIKYLNFSFVAYFLYRAIRYKSRMIIAIALIGLCNFFLLFILYDAFDWREIRTMSPLFYFYIIFIVTHKRKELSYVLVIVLCLLFFPTIKMSNQWISERNGVQVEKSKKEAYKEIEKKIGKDKMVLLDYIPRDYSTDLLDLPLRNVSGFPIRYIIQYYKVEKKHYDYTILRPDTFTQNSKIIDNEYYTLISNRPKESSVKNLSADEYIKLSLLHYRKREYIKSIEASRKVILLDSNNSIAYNNMCASYNRLRMYDEAKIACEKSLKIEREVALTKNNYKESLQGIAKDKKGKFTPKHYLSLSSNYYKLGHFNKCINASLELLRLEPDSKYAYNNICSSYNALKKYEDAMKACKKALEIDPDYQLAKNNLKWSKNNLNY